MNESKKELPPFLRDDLSNKLIHLTKGTKEEAKKTFEKIITDTKLLGSDMNQKKMDKVICFSEAPISKLGLILAYGNFKDIRYMPYGFMFDKNYLFTRGARPVIYQTQKELSLLHESQKFRHVTYDPKEDKDFTWEREWRIKTEELVLDPKHVTLIVPSMEIEKKMHNEHSQNETAISLALDGIMPIQSFPWHMISLADLGFDMSKYL